MDYFNRNRRWTLAFLLLLTLNIAALSFTAFWLIKNRNAGRPHEPKGGVTGFLVKELGFDAIQQEKLQELITDHRKQVMDIRKHNRAAKDAFFALLKEPEVGDSLLEQSARKATAFDQQLDMITFRHFQQVRKLCTAAQKEKFDAIIQEVLSMGAPPPGNPHGPPPPPMK